MTERRANHALAAINTEADFLAFREFCRDHMPDQRNGLLRVSYGFFDRNRAAFSVTRFPALYAPLLEAWAWECDL